MEKETIPLKTAIGMWTQNFRGMYDEIKDIEELPVSKSQYERFLNRIKKHHYSAFSTMFIINGEIDRKDFIVGLCKDKGRWVVDKEKFLIALNQKREVHKTGAVENQFEMMLQHLGVEQNLCYENIITPDKQQCPSSQDS